MHLIVGILFIFLAFALIFTNKQKKDLKGYIGNGKKLNLSEFFNGRINVTGIMSSRTGMVVKSFTGKIEGKKEENGVSIKDEFLYSDGEKMERTWNIVYMENQNFKVLGSNISGHGKGIENQNAAFMKYTFFFFLRHKKVEIVATDWFYLQTEKLMICKTYLTKFGFKVAELMMVFEKE